MLLTLQRFETLLFDSPKFSGSRGFPLPNEMSKGYGGNQHPSFSVCLPIKRHTVVEHDGNPVFKDLSRIIGKEVLLGRHTIVLPTVDVVVLPLFSGEEAGDWGNTKEDLSASCVYYV